MGWRYRKSINLGGGFRINLSKSGIGYSWGFPGYRHTYSANGTQRKTYSIPGTGISYVEGSGKSNNNPTNENVRYDDNTKLITGDVKYYKNQNISSIGKDDELLKQINKLRTIDILANVCLFSIVLIPIGIILKILISQKWKIDLTYEMDDINTKKFESINNFLIELSKNKRLWQIGSSVHVYNTKYNAGAGNNVTRHPISICRKMPWYISKNIDVYCLNLTDEKIYFTPERMLIFKKFGGVGVRSYNDMVANFSWTNFVETEFVPRDSEIVRYTWTYVNKSGGPDKRFNNNRQIPVCKYEEIQLQTEDGINIMLNSSNHQLTSTIQDKFIDFMNYHNQILKMEKENNFSGNKDINNYSAFDKNDKWNNYNDEIIENNLEDIDPLYNDVLEYVISTGKASASMLQRKFRFGYNRAARLIDLLEEKGVIGSQNGTQPREVLVKNKETHTILEEISNPVIIHQPNIEEKSKNKDEIQPQNEKKSSIVSKVLCYMQVVFSFFTMMGCISDKMVIASICWLIIALIFIPKVKTILIEKYPNIKPLIIPLRIVLVFVGFMLIGITAPTS